MRSLPKVIKLAELATSEEVYQIPDSDHTPVSPGSGDTSSPEDGEEPETQGGKDHPRPDLEQLEQAARQRAERLTREAKEQAEEIAQKVLQSAKSERARLVDQARADAEKIREESRRQGYQDGLEEKRQSIEKRLGELDRLMERLQQDQERFLKQYEEGLFALALEIAQKVLDESITLDGSLMRPLVQKAVSAAKNAEWISVEVSSRLPGLAEELKKELAGRADLPRLDVTAAEMPPGGCMVQTPEGIIDASVGTQLENLKGLFDGPR